MKTDLSGIKYESPLPLAYLWLTSHSIVLSKDFLPVSERANKEDGEGLFIRKYNDRTKSDGFKLKIFSSATADAIPHHFCKSHLFFPFKRSALQSSLWWIQAQKNSLQEYRPVLSIALMFQPTDIALLLTSAWTMNIQIQINLQYITKKRQHSYLYKDESHDGLLFWTSNEANLLCITWIWLPFHSKKNKALSLG